MPLPEEPARLRIDAALAGAGWAVQDQVAANVKASHGGRSAAAERPPWPCWRAGTE
jgi:hypothetical protein